MKHFPNVYVGERISSPRPKNAQAKKMYQAL